MSSTQTPISEKRRRPSLYFLKISRKAISERRSPRTISSMFLSRVTWVFFFLRLRLHPVRNDAPLLCGPAYGGVRFQNNCGGVVYGAVSGSPVISNCTLTTTKTTVSITTTSVMLSIEGVASPDIYAWAVSSTVAVVVLAIILLRMRR